MSISEASQTTQFLKFVRSNPLLRHTFAFEAKICKEKSLPFSAVADHQWRNLYHTKHASTPINFKISDFSPEQKPFDGFQLFQTNAYIVIFWYQHRGDKRFTMIDIDDWLNEVNTSSRKSITFERASEIGHTLEL